jgi:hypothetical protein
MPPRSAVRSEPSGATSHTPTEGVPSSAATRRIATAVTCCGVATAESSAVAACSCASRAAVAASSASRSALSSASAVRSATSSASRRSCGPYGTAAASRPSARAPMTALRATRGTTTADATAARSRCSRSSSSAAAARRTSSVRSVSTRDLPVASVSATTGGTIVSSASAASTSGSAAAAATRRGPAGPASTMLHWSARRVVTIWRASRAARSATPVSASPDRSASTAWRTASAGSTSTALPTCPPPGSGAASSRTHRCVPSAWSSRYSSVQGPSVAVAAAWRSASRGCSPASQPAPASSSGERPVNAHQRALWNVRARAASDTHMSAGARSAVARSRASTPSTRPSCPHLAPRASRPHPVRATARRVTSSCGAAVVGSAR